MHIDTSKMYNNIMHKKCLIITEDTTVTVTLCEIDTSKMYNIMHKKCLIITEDTTVTLCEIDTSKMYNNILTQCHSSILSYY